MLIYCNKMKNNDKPKNAPLLCETYANRMSLSLFQN